MEDSTTHQALVGKLLALHKEFIQNSEKVNFCQEIKNGLRTLTLSIQLPDNAISNIKRKKKEKSGEQIKEYVDVSQYSDEKSLKILTKYVPKTAAETDLREKKLFVLITGTI